MMLEQLRYWRRNFHHYPEAGWCEYRTSSLIAAELSACGYQILLGDQVLSAAAVMGRQIDEAKEKARAAAQGAPQAWLEASSLTGLVAILDTGRPGPCVGLRVDLDAVKVQESQESQHLPHQQGFASVNAHCMHACGHDGHAAMGLVLGQLLAQQQERLVGRIKLFFQPAEEGCRGGKAMAQGGQLDDVDILYAIHLGIHAASGELVVAPTGFLSSTKFDVEFHGTPAHAGLEPNAGANALAAACQAVSQMLGIPPHRDGLTRLNVGTLNAGADRNVIPSFALLEGETRGASAELNDYMFGRVQQIVEGCARSYGVDYRIRKQGEAISIENSPCLVHSVTLSADQLGFHVIHSRCFGASDDAGYMLERVQKRGGEAAYLVIGADLAAGHHHHGFDFDETAMVKGVSLLAALFVAALQPPAEVNG
ncbi:MAG: amidohydrolase [Aeromonadaceae bacterium]|nr:amidohydrolase [Aeromonadaceae bacterium]